MLGMAVLFTACKHEDVCKTTMTVDYIEHSCSLINGIQFDELRVDTFGIDHLPYVFYLKECFSYGKYRSENGNESIDNIIFFNKPSVNYAWQTDSSRGIFNISVVEYKYRGSISSKDRSDHSYQIRSDTCPVRFKPDTWYLVDFRPATQIKHMEFLHVEKGNKFTFYPLKQ